MTPHVDWRGAYALGTWDDGSSNPCTGSAPKCSYIAWPAIGMSAARGHPLDVTLPSGYWMGSLLSEATDGSGMQYKRNRYYDPASGRFTQVDPIGLAGGLNAYGFGGGDQVNFSDPFGLCPPCTVSDDGAAFIAGFEGFRPNAYKDVAGYLTIGYGHRIMDGEKFDKPLTKEQALDLLKQDITDRVQSGLDKVKPDLAQNEVDALGSFIFNIGSGAFGKSTLLKKLNKNDREVVPSELNRWNKVYGKPNSDLTQRRAAEGKLWNSGDHR
jgi:RHS repeat-associated protein